MKSLQERLFGFVSKQENFAGPAAQLDAAAFERELQSPVHLVVFRVVYLPMTAKLPSRIKIISERFKQSVVVSRHDNKFDKVEGIQEIAIIELKERGFNIVAFGEGIGCMYVMSDTFKPFKE